MATRRAAWEAQRAVANLKLRNLGPGKTDTLFNADRRMYKEQLSALRREWLTEDLNARRAAYVESRSRAAQSDTRSAGAAQHDAAREARREERARELSVERARLDKERANSRRVSEKRSAKRDEAEAEFLRRWMHGVLKEYDVEGTASTLPIRSGMRSWLHPENFEKRVHLLLMQSKSPVEKWNRIARQLQAEEEREALAERLGGRLLPSDASLLAPYDGGGGGESAPAASSSPPATRGSKASAAPPAAPPELLKEDEAFLHELGKVIADLEPPPPPPKKGE